MMPVGVRYRRIDRHGGELRLRTAAVSDRDTEAAAVLAPEAVGVCRSDLRELTGDRHQRRDFGHEIVARVVAARPDGLLPPGCRVVFDPHPALDRTSGFGELVELYGRPDALSAALVPVDETLDAAVAVQAEPLACAVHCVRRLETASRQLGLQRDDPVAIVGAGAAGALIAAVLLAGGVPAQVTNRGSARVEFLRRRGFLPAPSLAAIPDGRRFPRVVLATAAASPEALGRAVRLVEPNGLLMLFAGTRPGTGLGGIDLDPVRRRQQLVPIRADGSGFYVAGTHGAVTDDFRKALTLLAPSAETGLPDRLAALVTDELSLDQATRTLPRHAASGFLGKTLVRPAGPTSPRRPTQEETCG
jgi:threonine dehydrogenase-like Zn-dependent dehydrogenase